MKYILVLLRQSSTASHIRAYNQRGESIEVAVRHSTLEMNWRVGENWRDYSNDDLVAEIKLLLGKSPVSTNLIINRLANSHTELAVKAVVALIQWLSTNQQTAIQAIANRRLLEVQGLTDDELCA